MSREQIFSEVKELVKPYVKNMDVFNSATEETTFLKDLQINSARLVDIILDMETKFDITVSDEEADSVRTLGSAVDLLLKKREG
jgi:acyl carrier protein